MMHRTPGDPRRGRAAALLAAMILLAAAASVTEAAEFVFQGRILAADGQPAEGYRLVFRVVDDVAVYISLPADEEGRYQATVASDRTYSAVAAISPSGQRVSLAGTPEIPARPGADYEVTLPVLLSEVHDEPCPFTGSDRLFLSFVEDTALVKHRRAEGQIRSEQFDSADALVTEYVAALRFEVLPDVEFGGRLGYGGVDFDTGGGQTGLTDLELWGKYHFGRHFLQGFRFAAGGLLTLPTGDKDTGLSVDAFRLKIFGASRVDVGSVTLAASLGFRFNDDGTFLGTNVKGETALSASFAVLRPMADRWVLVGELAHEGERFDGAGADTRVLAGASWQPFSQGMFRFALAGGLADGAPDVQVIAGYAFDF